MLPELEKLLVLHDRDTRRYALQAELAQLPKDEARVQNHLSADQATVAAVKEKLTKNAMEMKSIELDIGTRKTTLERLKTQQFETKKNDEFKALESEITRYNDQVDELETSQLELMEQADDFQSELTAAEEALGKSQKLVNEELANFQKKREACEAEIAELEAERSTLGEEISAPTLTLYNRLLESKKGQAMAQVKGGACGGCHMKLVPATLSVLRAHKELAQCENCSRILYEV